MKPPGALTSSFSTLRAAGPDEGHVPQLAASSILHATDVVLERYAVSEGGSSSPIAPDSLRSEGDLHGL